jgi:hypothetical protein
MQLLASLQVLQEELAKSLVRTYRGSDHMIFRLLQKFRHYVDNRDFTVDQIMGIQRMAERAQASDVYAKQIAKVIEKCL